MRLDLFLVAKGFAPSRTRALNLIKLNAVTVDGKPALKPSAEVDENSVIEISDKIKYSSLGGLKLEKAIGEFGIEVSGAAIDIGASNGGFTDCLLSHGAEKVYAVDVGSCALPIRLAKDPRVIVMDNTNAKLLTPSDFPALADIITIDVSFISILHILPVAKSLLSDTGSIIALVKPQFEAGRAALTKSGIVKDNKTRISALESVIESAKAFGLYAVKRCEAPVLFEDKNIEYLVLFKKSDSL